MQTNKNIGGGNAYLSEHAHHFDGVQQTNLQASFLLFSRSSFGIKLHDDDDGKDDDLWLKGDLWEIKQ